MVCNAKHEGEFAYSWFILGIWIYLSLYFGVFGWLGGVMGSIITSSSGARVSLALSVAFLQVLPCIPTSQNHAGRWNECSYV